MQTQPHTPTATSDLGQGAQGITTPECCLSSPGDGEGVCTCDRTRGRGFTLTEGLDGALEGNSSL